MKEHLKSGSWGQELKLSKKSKGKLKALEYTNNLYKYHNDTRRINNKVAKNKYV